MLHKFNNRYRIESARLKGWDYGCNGTYFITICTKNRNHYFGEIKIKAHAFDESDIGTPPLHFISNTNSLEKKYDELTPHQDQISQIPMSILNPIGAIAYEMWLAIPTYFPFIQLGCFVIMPNHVHGILIINDKNGETRNDKNGETQNDKNGETRLIASLPNTEIKQKKGGFAGDKNPMFHSNISRVIRWYKGRCSFEIRKLNENFGWQSRFYDHIIRTPRAFENIQNYIENNPTKWAEDCFNEID